MMANILQRALNPRVAPRRILLRHAHHELADLGQDTATPGSLLRKRPLARHQVSMPAQQRVRRDECRHITQGGSTQPKRAYGEPPPVVVRQPQAPPADLSPQNAILFNKIRERFTLAAIQPACDGEKQQLEDRNVDHERRLISRSAKTSDRPSIEEWDTTGDAEGSAR